MPPLAKLMLIAIYRWTAGFHRNKCKISDATITDMTGIKTPNPHRKFLIENDYIKYHHTDGTTGIYEIPPNIINRSKKQPPNRIDSTPQFSEGDPLIELNGYQEAKENIKENLKKESGTLSDDLVVEMKSNYPDLDVTAIITKVRNKGYTVTAHNVKSILDREIKPLAVIIGEDGFTYYGDFKCDTVGFPIGWCEKCNKSDFYKFEELNGDSNCCNAKILPSKQVANV